MGKIRVGGFSPHIWTGCAGFASEAHPTLLGLCGSPKVWLSRNLRVLDLEGLPNALEYHDSHGTGWIPLSSCIAGCTSTIHRKPSAVACWNLWSNAVCDCFAKKKITVENIETKYSVIAEYIVLKRKIALRKVVLKRKIVLQRNCVEIEDNFETKDKVFNWKI